MGQKYGQHFLSDLSMLERIAREVKDFCHDEKNIDTIVEIGPGQGALTKHLIKNPVKLVCYEVDVSLEKRLKQFQEQGANVIRGDVLEQEVSYYDQVTTLVVGNLPYYITSPIFRKFFEEHQFLGGVFLIQKEVAEKIMTKASKKSYLRWLLNNHYVIDYCFTVPAGAFSPPPKVESAVVRFQKQDPQLERDGYTKLLQILDSISPYKRKTLGKIGKMTGVVIPESLQGLRLEELHWEGMRKILAKN